MKFKLVPRFKEHYAQASVEERRHWLETLCDAQLTHVGHYDQDPETWSGNLENPIGVAQVPLGVAGPLLVNGEHACGAFYVPLATTEGALVRSYERGMVTLSRSGGVDVRMLADSNEVTPTFFFDDVVAAVAFARAVPEAFEQLRKAAESTTRHGHLLAVLPRVDGRRVLVCFRFATGDAHGMNMIVKAAEAACRALSERHGGVRFHIFSGLSSEKRASAYLFGGGKGKKLVAGACIPAKWCRTYLHVTPAQMVELYQQTTGGHLHAGAVGYNGHLANGLTALFIATGQDVANVGNSAVGHTCFEMTQAGDLYLTLTLPALTVATVGGGVALGSHRECLEMLDCFGSGKAPKLAEIAAATALAGELSFGAAIASGEFVKAHEDYGRNRPEEEEG